MEDRRKYYYLPGYENGSAARKLKPQWEASALPHVVEEVPEILTPQMPEQTPAQAPQRAPKPKSDLNLLSVLLLVGAITATVFVCVLYLRVQSDILAISKQITAIEKEITATRIANNAAEEVLENEVSDLEKVYQIAVHTLGMVYPNNNEVVYYENEDTGYFREFQNVTEQ